MKITSQEALWFFKEELKEGKCSDDCLQCNSMEMAIEALEKTIPKQPNLEGDGYDENGNLIYDTWICPCCEEHYEVDYDNYEHCPKCGQTIDRSDMD